MAAQGKSTGLQVGLMLAVAAAVVASVVAFVIYRDADNTVSRLGTLEQEKTNVQNKAEGVRQDIDEVKRLVGPTANEVGRGDEAPGTVLGEIKEKIAAYNTNSGETTLFQVVEQLHQKLQQEKITAAEQALTIKKIQREMTALESKYAARTREHDTARMAAFADVGDVQTQADERVRTVQAAKQELEDQLATTRASFEEVKEQMNNGFAVRDEQIEELTLANRRLTRELAQRDTGAFPTPDGKIVSLQRSSDTVYLDIGSRQNLRPGVTFSVYDKEKVGPTGGDFSALKGSIEVLSVEENISEARITEVTTIEPLSVGDVVFSPAWSPGRKSQFAFVGMIDLDGDGNTIGERDRLRRILADNGAETSVYIDDEGNWIDGDGNPEVNQPLDVDTEMLVLGHIPDPSEVSDPARKQAFTKMREHLSEIRNQAERNGIQVRNLKSFLDLVGHRPTRRRFVPGDDPDFNLRNDRSRQVDPDPGSATTGLFDPNRGRRGSQIDPQPSTRFNPQR